MGLLGNVKRQFCALDQILLGRWLDEWLQLTAGGFSPPGTAFARSVLVQVQGGDGAGNFVGGAIFWDEAFLMQVPEPTSMALLGLSGLGMLLIRRKR